MERGFFSFVVWSSWALIVFVVLKALFFVSLSSKHHSRHKRLHPKKLSTHPLVSVIVPCYNEGLTVKNCIDSLVDQSYDNYEIVIVNDGSSDNTLQVAKRLAALHRPLIRVVDKKGGGKASALNRGIGKAKGEIVVCIDADSIFMRDTVEQLVLTFHDPDVAAVGGNVKVANKHKLLGRQQSLEYITGLTLQRKAFAYLGCMQVISGAIGAFRRDALLAIGGYSTDTMVEDMDTTIELAKQGYKVAYNPNAISYTEAPESLGAFIKQRKRWIYGSFQVLAKHRDFLWKRNTNYMGFIGMPYFLLSPWLDAAITFLYAAAIIRIIISGNPGEFIAMTVFMFVLQSLLITFAIVSDKEDKKLIALTVIDSFVYYHLLNLCTMKAGIEYIRNQGRLVHRNKQWKTERYGKNTIPVGGQALATAPVSIEETV